jgi:hypothetical protein
MGMNSWSRRAKRPIRDPGDQVGHDDSGTTENFPLRTGPAKSKLLLVVALFAFCVGPTFISYKPYLFRWDDADYLTRAITVSRALWSLNEQALVAGMVSIRPPAMTFLGVPWGSMPTWNAAGDCFITLAAAISCMAALCFYLLLRIGVSPSYLIAAALCVFASIGPYPQTATAHADATAFLADSLFAWTCLAAVLLIPHELRTPRLTVTGTLVRGILWGAVLSLGMMTKLNFLYFIVLIIPVIAFITFRRGGPRSTLAALTAFACCSAPAFFYLLRWGRPAFDNAKASSFGGVAGFYYLSFQQFVGDTVRESPGLALSIVLTTAVVIFAVSKRRLTQRWPDFLALLIMIVFAIIVFSATNRQIRYAFPAIVALPFLVGILMSAKGHAVPARYAGLAAGLVFFALFAAGIPMRHRPDRQSIRRCDAVLALAARCNVAVIHLATDSPTLNGELLKLATKFSSGRVLIADTFAYQAMSGVPIEDDLRFMNKFFGLVVFQDRKALAPLFTNQRVPEYENYVRRVGFGPIKVGDDMTAYLMHSPKHLPSGCAVVP